MSLSFSKKSNQHLQSLTRKAMSQSEMLATYAYHQALRCQNMAYSGMKSLEGFDNVCVGCKIDNAIAPLLCAIFRLSHP